MQVCCLTFNKVSVSVWYHEHLSGYSHTYSLIIFAHGSILHNNTVGRVAGLRLTEDESDYLWEKRNYLYDYPSALPRIIQVRIDVSVDWLEGTAMKHTHTHSPLTAYFPGLPG